MNEKFILTLMDKFDSINIDELDVNDGSTRLVLRRGFLPGAGAGTAAGASSSLDRLPLPATTEPEADPGRGGKSVHLGIPASAEGSGDTITSPIVATFYSAPGPDAPPFVQAGSRVKAGQTLCILEAMKMMNHLEAEFDCEIVQTHASNGDLVEYDQILFTVKRL